MPFAPKIRKEILKALDESIIPALNKQKVLLLHLEPPFDFSEIEYWTFQEEPLPDNDRGPLQVIRRWPEQQMVASRGFNISFLYEGAMHRRIGILEKHAQALRGKGLTPMPGIQILKLSAPSAALAANFVAREDGSLCSESVSDRSRTVSISFDRGEAHTFHSSRNLQERHSSHHLQLKDQTIIHLGRAYLEEMRLKHSQEYAQTLLLAIMHRLRYLLLHTSPAVGNSCWVDPISKTDITLTKTQIKHQALCEDVIDYVQSNIHTPLSVGSIAAHFSLSTFHISKVFREVHGITLMRYVTRLRVDIAKRILADGKERISDIARLTGFASTASFSHVFRNQTGLSPSEFRAKSRKALR